MLVPKENKDNSETAVQTILLNLLYVLLHYNNPKLQLSVCLYVRARGHASEAIRPQLNFFSLQPTAGRYIKESTDTVSKGASSRLKDALLRSVVQK